MREFSAAPGKAPQPADSFVQANISGLGPTTVAPWIDMQKHITREFDTAADAQLESATDAVAAAIQFVRAIADDHATHRPRITLKLPFEAEKKAEAVDDAVSSVAESSAAEYVRQIARGTGPAERQQFSLGNQVSWDPGRALPQFLFQGKPILLTDPEQVARWDRLAKQEALQNAPGRMAQLFNAQRTPAPSDIADQLEKTAEGKIIFQSADRPGWDKVIYYRAGEKRAAERLAHVLRNNQELTEEQQTEVWRLEGWPEADVARELERMRNVRRMHDESWWTPQPSLMERARDQAKILLSFGRAKKVVRPLAKVELEQPQQFFREIERSAARIAKLPESAPLRLEGPVEAEVQRFPEHIAKLPQSAPFKVEGPAETNGSKADIPLSPDAFDPSEITRFHQSDSYAAVRPHFDRARAKDDGKPSGGLSRQDEPVFRWLEAAMEDLHRHTQSQRRALKGKRPSAP